MPKSHTQAPVLAHSADIRHLLGDLDEHVILDILALKPTVTQIEEAALRIEGEDEAVARMRPASVTVAKIVELAGAEEFEEPEAGGGHQ